MPKPSEYYRLNRKLGADRKTAKESTKVQVKVEKERKEKGK
jgi:hypothetical protein